MYDRLVVATRFLLGAQLLMGGLNWWIKIFPFPNMFDPMIAYAPGLPQKVEVARMMIDTGWMFHLAKIIELSTGLALLLNLFIPMMLVISITITLSTFVVDALIGSYIVGWFAGTVPFVVLWKKILDMIFFGGAVLIMQAFLMLAYLHYYLPMLTMKGAYQANAAPEQFTIRPGFLLDKPCVRRTMLGLGGVAVILGILSTGWLALIAGQWALPWSTLGVMVIQ